MEIAQALNQIKLPKPNSHKGQNGKLLIIGGSHLFHAASRWSLDIASKFVDMVFYSSVDENNELIKKAKQNFWNGIVIKRNEIEKYIEEASCILIGPGMERCELDEKIHNQKPNFYLNLTLSEEDWQNNTQLIVNYLLVKYPDKKWVIDAGALQMVNPSLLNKNCILTPHKNELLQLTRHAEIDSENFKTNDLLLKLHQKTSATILLKGMKDLAIFNNEIIEVVGGNAGMTKGGTGDVLAGLVAGLYANNAAEVSTIAASFVNKKAGELLFKKVGPFFNASELVEAIPLVVWRLIEA